MINIDKPSLIAVFLNENQIKEVIKENFNLSLIDTFISKLNILYPYTEIYSNYKFSSNTILIESKNEKDFILNVSHLLPKSISTDEDFDEIYFAYFQGIYPVLSLKSSLELTERHKRYISQYSYSENLPIGIVPTLISREFISTLPDNLNTKIHDFLLKNINNYDTEIYYVAPDLRNLRLDFSLCSRRSIDITEKLLNENINIEYSEILPILKSNPSIFRGGPSYLEVEIYRGCDLSCTFCLRETLPKDLDGKFIDIFLFQKIIHETEEISDSYTICLGGMGEPLKHPDIIGILKIALLSSSLKEIIIETTLYNQIDELIQFFNTLNDVEKEKIILIINLTTLKQDIYRGLYKNSITNVEIILEKIELLKNNLGKNSLYVQMLKIQEIESEIEEYFNFFEEKNINVLLQKYNSYARRLPEKRVSDLTPINREFCWHLSRDIYIQANGDVSACKQTGPGWRTVCTTYITI